MPLNSFKALEVPPVVKAECDKVPELMIIAGPNGVGKSTLLYAMFRFPKGLHMGNSISSITGRLKPVYFPPHRAPVPFSFHKSFPHITPSIRSVDVLTNENHAFESSISPVDRMLRTTTSRNRNFPDFAPYFVVKDRLARFEFESGELANEIYRNHGEVKKGAIPDIFEPLRTIIKFLLPGLTFDSVEVSGEAYHVNFVNKMGKKVEFDSLSSGEKDCMAMLFPLIEKKIENIIRKVKEEESPSEDLIILIDTPEANLHTSLQIIFLQFIRQAILDAKKQGESLQFVIVTHSPIIIDNASSEELFLMTFPDSDNNQLISASELDLKELQSYLGNLGLSNFTTGKPLLLLEGKNDCDVFKLLFPKIQHNFVLNYLEGKSKIISFLSAFEKIHDDLQSRRIHIFGILDGDREDIVKTKSQEVRKSVFTLPVTCLENYLLDSEAIFESLKILVGHEKLSKMGITSEKDIDVLISDIIKKPDYLTDELKKRINENLTIFVNISSLTDITKENVENCVDEITTTKKARIEKILSVQTTLVQDYITNKNLDKLDGKLIMKKIGEKFDKSHDEMSRGVSEKLRELGKVPTDLAVHVGNLEKLI